MRAASDLLQAVDAHGALGVFAEVLRGSGLAEVLAAGRYTLFAPTDDAFAELPSSAVAALLAEPSQLAGLMARHATTGLWRAGKLVRKGRVELLSGGLAWVGAVDGLLILFFSTPDHFATVIRPDLTAGSCVLHLLDTVL